MVFGGKEQESFCRLDYDDRQRKNTSICINRRFTVTYSFVVVLFEYSVLLCSQTDHLEPDLMRILRSTSLSPMHVILMEQIPVTSFSIVVL